MYYMYTYTIYLYYMWDLLAEKCHQFLESYRHVLRCVWCYSELIRIVVRSPMSRRFAVICQPPCRFSLILLILVHSGSVFLSFILIDIFNSLHNSLKAGLNRDIILIGVSIRNLCKLMSTRALYLKLTWQQWVSLNKNRSAYRQLYLVLWIKIWSQEAEGDITAVIS